MDVHAEKILDALRNLPLWLFTGLAAACWAVLFLPGFGNVELYTLHHAHGPYIWASGVVFSVLALARSVALSIDALRALSRPKTLQIVPVHNRSFWGQPKQPNGVIASELRFDLHVTNLLGKPTRILRARVLRPLSWRKIEPQLLLVEEDEPNHFSSRQEAYPDYCTRVVAHFAAMRAIGAPKDTMRVKIELTDQYGNRNSVWVTLNPLPFPK